MTVHEQLVTILVDQLGVDVAEVTLSASLFHDLGADSLDAIEIGLALDETLDLDLTDHDIQELGRGTVGQALALVEARLQDQAAVRRDQEVRRG